MKLRCYKDYRAHCGFPRVTAFDEISRDARGRKGLRDVYRSVNDTEFYVGVFPENTRLVSEDAFLPLGCHIIRTTRRVSDLLNCDVLPRDLPYGETMTRSDRQRR